MPFGALSIKPQRPKLEDTEPPTDYMCQIWSMLYHCASVARGLHLSSACVFWSAWVVRSAPRRPQRTNEISRKLSGLGESLGSESPEGWRRAPELLCKPNARGQSIAEGNKLDGTPIGTRTLTRPVHGWNRPESHKALGRLGYHGAPHTPGTRLMSQNLKTLPE